MNESDLLDLACLDVGYLRFEIILVQQLAKFFTGKLMKVALIHSVFIEDCAG